MALGRFVSAAQRAKVMSRLTGGVQRVRRVAASRARRATAAYVGSIKKGIIETARTMPRGASLGQALGHSMKIGAIEGARGGGRAVGALVGGRLGRAMRRNPLKTFAGAQATALTGLGAAGYAASKGKGRSKKRGFTTFTLGGPTAYAGYRIATRVRRTK